MTPAAIITGASAGIGEALARTFARKGHVTVLIARRAERLTALAEAIAREGAPSPVVLPLDIAERDAADRIGSALEAHDLEPAYVVNNAGFGLVGAAAELDRDEQLAMTDVNVRALTDLSLAWIDSLARHRGGILNVASVAGFLPGPGMAVYHATKAYVVAFSEALHAELKPRGIRVTALCPGPVPTEFQARAGLRRETYPPIVTVSAARAADEGYRGLMRGRRVVVPGIGMRGAALALRLVPRGLVLAAAGARNRRRKAGAA